MKCGIIVVYIFHTIFYVVCDESSSEKDDEKTETVTETSTPFDPSNLPPRSPQFEKAVAAGNYGDIMGTNEHHAISDVYKTLGRRFVPQYPYYETDKQAAEDKKAEDVLHKVIQDSKTKFEKEDLKLLPVKASPELVLAVAKQSKLLEEAKPFNPVNDEISKKSLRTGEYWNDVWVEDVNPNKPNLPNILRTGDMTPKKKVAALPRLGTVRTKIMPGTRLYELISALKSVSPKFLYVINVN